MLINFFKLHSKEAFILGASKALERASFYGLRAILILYIVSSTVSFSEEQAAKLYSWFIGCVIISGIIGGFLGDLIFGNRKASIIGMILNAVGAFVISIPTIPTVYIGLTFFVLGSGLYTPNFLSQYGQFYRSKVNLMDSGFILLHVVIGIGSSIGVLLIGHFEVINFSFGFVLVGILSLLSAFVFQKSKDFETEYTEHESKKLIPNYTKVVFMIIGVFVFWIASQLLVPNVSQLVDRTSFDYAQNMMVDSLPSILSILFILILMVYWTIKNHSHYKKLLLGYLFTGIAAILALIIQNGYLPNKISYYSIIITVIAAGEVFIKPIVNSVIARYGNVNHLAIIYSLTVIPFAIIPYLIGFFEIDNVSSELMVSVILFSFMALCLLLFKTIRGKSDLVVDN